MEPPSTPGNVGGNNAGTGIPNGIGIPIVSLKEELVSRVDDQPKALPYNPDTMVATEDEIAGVLEPKAVDRSGEVEEGEDVAETTTAATTSIETSTAIASSLEAGEEEKYPNNGDNNIHTPGGNAPSQQPSVLSRPQSADRITEQKHDSIAPPKTPISPSRSDPNLAVPSFGDVDSSNHTKIVNNTNTTNETPESQSMPQHSHGNSKKQSATTLAITPNSKANTTTTTFIKPKKSATTTLAALFGGPNIGNVPGVYSKSNNLNVPAAQHDYTLVGDSPYDTTYDPQSPYYYNRVFGQLYITTISVMFRGKAFGPIGAIPYERRLLLPFLEISRIDAYKTTSIKITMNDDETYVFKSFDERDDAVRLLRRTRKKCHDDNETIATGIVDGAILSHQHQPNDSNTATNRSLDSSLENDTSSSTSADESQEDGRENMPLSFRKQPKAGALSNLSITTPRQNTMCFDDKVETEKRNNNRTTPTTSEKRSKTPKKETLTTPSQLILPNSLRLSMHDDDLLEEKKDPVGDPNGPRRLFPADATSSAMAPVAAMLSPPRTRISHRRNNQTPRERGPVEIPSIPTVPSLNTPEPQAHGRVINIDARIARGSAIPLPIPEIANDGSTPPSSDGSNGSVRVAPRILAPVTPASNSRRPNTIQNSTSHDLEQEKRIGAKWQAAVQTSPKTQKDWQVALEPNRLSNCTLDDWFDLFFSDDAIFSLARYQLEHVGDRDVSFHPWRRKPSPLRKPNTTSKDENGSEYDGIPELEREISYIHPIGGKTMIGPSEAETFRVQSLKRYGSHGAILKNVTTVGKSIPMGDCFHVEDKWIIEQEAPNSLKLSVNFRVVFVKRTMFKGIIQKNTLSETKEWFQGYSKILQAALESPERQELQRRKQQQEIDLLGGSVSLDIASPSSAHTLSTKDSGVGHPKSEAPVQSSQSSPRSDSLTTTLSAVTASQKSYRNDSYNCDASAKEEEIRTNNFAEQWNDSGAKTAGAPGATVNPVPVVVLTIAAIVVCLLLATVVALWLQVRSVSTSLSVLEGGLGELQAQNMLLLQKLEELTVVNALPSLAADPDTAGAILLFDLSSFAALCIYFSRHYCRCRKKLDFVISCLSFNAA